MELYVNLYFLGIQKDTHLFDGALNKQTFDLLHFLCFSCPKCRRWRLLGN